MEKLIDHALTTDSAMKFRPLFQKEHLIYIIIIHREIVLLYYNSSVWLATKDVSIWDRNPSDFTLYMVSNPSAISMTCVNSEIITDLY